MRLCFIFKVAGNEDHHGKVVKVLQDIIEIVTNDMMLNGSRFSAAQTLFPFPDHWTLYNLPQFILNGCRILNLLHSQQKIEGEETEFFSQIEPQLFASKHSIHFPLPDSGPLNEQVILFTFVCGASLFSILQLFATGFGAWSAILKIMTTYLSYHRIWNYAFSCYRNVYKIYMHVYSRQLGYL